MTNKMKEEFKQNLSRYIKHEIDKILYCFGMIYVYCYLIINDNNK